MSAQTVFIKKKEIANLKKWKKISPSHTNLNVPILKRPGVQKK
jgi:hypothetical protein